MLQNTLKLFKKCVYLPSLHYQGLISKVQDLRRWHVLSIFTFLFEQTATSIQLISRTKLSTYSFLGSDSHPSLLVLDV